MHYTQLLVCSSISCWEVEIHSWQRQPVVLHESHHNQPLNVYPSGCYTVSKVTKPIETIVFYPWQAQEAVSKRTSDALQQQVSLWYSCADACLSLSRMRGHNCNCTVVH